MRLLYQLSVKEKQKIIDDLYKKNGFVTIADEMWQQILDHMNWQEKKIKELLAGMAETNKKLDDLRYIVENHDLNFKTSNTGSLEKSPTEKETSAKKEIITEKGDSYGFEPLIDGEKEEIEISDSWKEIFTSIGDGTYREKYKIGNYKSLDLGDEGIFEMQIAGFDAEPLADGSGRAAITWISRNTLKEKLRMNPQLKGSNLEYYEKTTGSIGGWRYSEIRKYLNSVILSLFPRHVKRAVKKVRKYSSATLVYNNNVTFPKENYESEDCLWIPSFQEVFGEYPEESLAHYYSVVYAYKSDRKKDSWWWLRSAKSEGDFYGVSRNGNKGNKPSEYPNGIVFGFCT